MSWRLAHALGGTPRAGLLGEINAAAPQRSVASDGGIGDTRHARSKSDHNPCRCCAIVCARDFTHDPKGGFDSYVFAEWLRQRVIDGLEPRVKYVISNGRIYSGEGQNHPAGVWRKYRGNNPHAHHVHVSVRHDACDDTAPWGWPPAAPAVS
jgi:hypothetical protein